MANLFDTMRAQVPTVAKDAAAQLEAGRAVALQQALGKAGQVKNVTAPAQEVAAQQITLGGQQDSKVRQQQAAQAANFTQVAQAQQAAEADQRIQTRQLGVQQMLSNEANAAQLQTAQANADATKMLTAAEQASANRMSALGVEQEARLLTVDLETRRAMSRLGEDVKDKLVDSRLQFERDELGRKFTNERQLRDYAATQAHSELEFQQRMRDLEETHERKLLLMEAAHNKIAQALQQQHVLGEQKLDYEHQRELLEKKRRLEKKINEAKAKAKNRALIGQGLGTLVGAAVGVGIIAASGGTAAPLAYAAAASIGASVGGALGSSAAAGTQ